MRRCVVNSSAGVVVAGHSELISDFGDTVFCRVGHCIAAKFADRIMSGALLGLLLATPPRRRKPLSPDLGGHLKTLAVIGPFFIHKVICGRHTVLPLGELL